MFLLLSGMHGAFAQENAFVDCGLEAFQADSIVPYVGFQIPLSGNFADTTYTVDIEFPELVPISADDLVRWNIQPEEVPSWPHVESFVGVSRGNATLDVEFMPLMERDGSLFAVKSFKPVIRSAPRGTGEPGTVSPADRYTRRSVLADGKWVKIRVSETGIYKLTDKFLRSAGFSDPSKVRIFGYGGAVLPEEDIQDLPDDLPELAFMQCNGFRLFYAQGPISWTLNDKGEYRHDVNTYSDWGYYFLTDTAPGEAAVFGTVESDSTVGRVVNRFPDYYAYDPDEFSWYRSGRRMFEAYNYANGSGRTYPVSLPGIIPDSVKLFVGFSSDCAETSKLSISINDKQVANFSIPVKNKLDMAYVSDKSYLCKGVFNEDNQIRILHDRASGNGHLDYIRLNFNRKLALYGSSTLFRTDVPQSGISYCVDASNQNVQIWKMTADGSMLTVPSQYSDGRTLTMAADYLPTDRLMAVDTGGQFPEPKSMGEVSNQNLHELDSIDMVIVVPSSGRLIDQAERLAKIHREHDGLSVIVTKASTIYNEFSSGTPDATSIRRFLKMLYDRAETGSEPRYLLLMGAGAWDNRMHVSDWAGNNPDDYLLCYESYNSVSEAASYVMEDYFGLLDDSEGSKLLKEKVDVGVGRLPVLTVDQARETVDKLVSYIKGENRGAWLNRIMVLGDDGDNNQHMKDAEDAAKVLAAAVPKMDISKIYWDSYEMEVTAAGNSYPSVRRLLLEELDKGALLVNYSGHGSTEVLSHELVLNKADMAELKSPRLPFWITASCDISPFDASVECIGRSLMLNPRGGAIGMLTTTRTVYSRLNRLINMSFSKYVLASDSITGKRYTTGDALRLAKNLLVTPGSGMSDNSENKVSFVLLGDPALKLDMAEMTAVVDSFAHNPALDSTNVAMAGGVITIAGHIECDGQPVPGFRGQLTATVFDNERHLVTLDNDLTADAPFEYDYRDRVLYSGTDSVRNGSFTFTFPVPMDINYSGKTGRISFFACSSDRKMTANGIYENFTVGGTDPSMRTDTVGPEMSFYLNSPSFQYGEKVNPTPLLIADLHDESGLNTSGNGLGHDILLVIDNDPNYTYVLNNSFTSSAGDYTSGRVVFRIPSLPEGKHTMMLRAWDVMNNSTTRYLGFKVVEGLLAQLSVEATENPASDGTTFVVVHDRPGQEAVVTVNVFDTKGVLQWTGKTDLTSNEGVSTIYWNLTGSSGHVMQPGLYIFNSVVETSGSRSLSKSGKLIVVGR